MSIALNNSIYWEGQEMISWQIDRTPTYIDSSSETTSVYSIINHIFGRKKEVTIDVNIHPFESKEEEKECCICMEICETINIVKLNCQHTFCGSCTYTTITTNNDFQQKYCPLCRTQISSIQVHSDEESVKFKNIVNCRIMN